MIDKIVEYCDNLPDIIKAVLFVSVISIFWSIVL